MFKILKNNLQDNGYDNHIYFGLTSEEIIELRPLLNNDYNCLDIILNFSDINNLDSLINNIPLNLNQELIQKYIYQYYLYYKILENLEDNTKLKSILFGNNIDDFKDCDLMLFSSVLEKLQSTAQDKRIRIHFFLDEHNNRYLQQQINDLIYMRIPVAVRCYTTNDNLITYLTTDGSLIESPHDYSGFYKKKFYQKIKN